MRLRLCVCVWVGVYVVCVCVCVLVCACTCVCVIGARGAGYQCLCACTIKGGLAGYQTVPVCRKKTRKPCRFVTSRVVGSLSPAVGLQERNGRGVSFGAKRAAVQRTHGHGESGRGRNGREKAVEVKKRQRKVKERQRKVKERQ